MGDDTVDGKSMQYTDGMNDLDHDFSEVVCTVRILYLLRDSGSQESFSSRC